MFGRSRRKIWYVVATMLVLTGGLAGCGLFNKPSGPPAAATATPPPTETPVPLIPTPTPSPMPALPTFTPTSAPSDEGPEPARPTLTPTTETAKPEVGGGEPSVPKQKQPQQVSYVVKTVPVMGDAVENGSFEEGFAESGIANSWAGFSKGDVGTFTWSQDLQARHISHGSSAQMLEISGAGQVDSYIGIFQTVEVMAGETYTLSMHGLIRSSTADDDKVPYGHRMQYGIDYNGGANWAAVQEWIDPGWNEVTLEEDNPQIGVYSLPITAKSDKLTLFIRGWTKWPIQSLAQFYVDGVFLKGPVPGEEEVVKVASTGGSGDEGMPTTGSSAIWVPIVGGVLLVGFALWEMRKVWFRSA
jgi:hypothetical protein